MARARNIKPGFFLNDKLAECDPLARLLFAGLWCIADREGRLEDRPKRIKAEVLPYDDCDPDDLLNQLAQRGFIIRYEVDGNRYIQITNFKKHQNPHVKEAPSIIPPPPEQELTPEKHCASSVQTPEKHDEDPADSLKLIPDSLKPHTDSLKRIPNTDGGAQSSVKTGKDGYTPEFEEFWDHYPRKVEKKRAFRVWKARLREGAKPETLIQACKNYAAYCMRQGIEPRYIKHPSTFLGPDKPFEEYIAGVPIDAKARAEPKSWDVLRQLYREYEEQERGDEP